MLSEKHLDSLVLKLSDNLKALQSTCSEFSSKCSSNKNYEDYPDSAEKFKEIQNFIINLKQSLRLCPDIISAAKESFMKLRITIKDFPACRKVETVQQQLTETARHLINLEQSHIASIDYRLDELLEMCLNKQRFDMVYIKKLEDQIYLKEQKGSPKHFAFRKVGNEVSSRGCTRCAQVSEEVQSITSKMQRMMGNFHSTVKTLNLSPQASSSSSLSMSSPHDREKNLKKLSSLQLEIKRLRLRVKDLEEKELQSIQTMSNLTSSLEEASKFQIKVEESQEKLKEKDLKIKKLLKIVEELSDQKKKMFESAAMLKEQLEIKVTEQDEQIKNLEEENISQIQTLKQKLLKNAEVEKINKDLQKEVAKLRNDYEVAIKNLQENETKLLQKSLQVEKSSHLSNFLSEKDLQIKSLEEKNDCLQNRVNEKDLENENLAKSLLSTKKALEEARKNLTNLFNEYDLLKNTSKQEIDALKSSVKSPRSSFSHSLSREKSKEIDSMNNFYISQINDLQNSLTEQKDDLNILHGKIEERDEYIKELESKIASFSTLAVSSKALGEDNKSLIESQTVISDFLSQSQNEYTSQLNSLKHELSTALEKNEELTRLLSCQHYLYSNFDKQRNSFPSPGMTTRVLTRQNTSPAVAGTQFKTVEAFKKLFESQDFDPDIMIKIGIELDEEDPSKFIDRIAEIKRDRDSLYLAAEKYEDLINELKEELEEDNENQLLACVIRLKGRGSDNDSIN